MKIFLTTVKAIRSIAARKGSMLLMMGLSFLVLGLVTAPFARGAGTPKGVKELMNYKGADREQVLQAEAKKEGGLTLYAQINTEDALQILKVFEKKYGITTKLYRAQGENVLQRVLTETKAGRLGGDAIELDSPFLTILKGKKLLAPFWSPHLDKYPKQSKDPDGYWQGERLTFDVFAYNTKMVSPAEAPRTYEDLLKPQYKGRIGMEGRNADWFATLVKYWGDEKGLAYFKKLGGQGLHVRNGHSLLTILTVSGEFPMTISSYNHRVEQLKAEGAPIEWIPLDPVVAIPSGVAVPVQAIHPASGILFTDFLLSKEGQEVLKSLKRVPAHLEVQADPPRLNGGFNYIPLFTDSAQDYEKWERLYKELIVSKGRGKS